MKSLTHRVNQVLKPLFADAGIELVDYKLEFGHAVSDPAGPLLLGDEFTPGRVPSLGPGDRRRSWTRTASAATWAASSKNIARSRSGSACRCSEASAAVCRAGQVEQRKSRPRGPAWFAFPRSIATALFLHVLGGPWRRPWSMAHPWRPSQSPWHPWLHRSPCRRTSWSPLRLEQARAAESA